MYLALCTVLAYRISPYLAVCERKAGSFAGSAGCGVGYA